MSHLSLDPASLQSRAMLDEFREFLLCLEVCFLFLGLSGGKKLELIRPDDPVLILVRLDLTQPINGCRKKTLSSEIA